MREKDLFANFARMRREMDEMLGGTWGRATYISRRASGFSPSVDVYYANDPERAVVKCELAGIEIGSLGIEVSGRQVTIIGRRPLPETEGRVFQQVEIPTGPFRSIVELQVDVDSDRAEATYEDGLLTVELPLRSEEDRVRRVPVNRG
jgi:HSP20 family protein